MPPLEGRRPRGRLPTCKSLQRKTLRSETKGAPRARTRSDLNTLGKLAGGGRPPGRALSSILSSAVGCSAVPLAAVWRAPTMSRLRLFAHQTSHVAGLGLLACASLGGSHATDDPPGHALSNLRS
jgi:hypothetical protein